MRCPLVQTQTERKYLTAFTVHVSVCNGGSAELHEMEGAHQADVMLLDVISVIDDGGRERQGGKSIE